MGLSSDDKKPFGITMEEAYTKIREWYQRNIDLATARGDDYGKRSAELIKHLPKVEDLTILEIKAIFGEVVYGLFEWAYHKDDGHFKMASYVLGALESANLSWSLSDEEKKELKSSKLWVYFSFYK